MLFNSYQFLIFFPVVIFIYFLIPKKIRNIWLLLASYYYYMCWNAKYALLILAVTVLTYICGIVLQEADSGNKQEKQKRICKKIILGCSIAVSLGILLVFKYLDWLIGSLNMIFGGGIQLPFSFILPVGISFYTFQAIGYIIDVYRKGTDAEKNFIQYALFISFFPQLVAGPIERSKNMLSQLKEKSDFCYENAVRGLQIMLLGYFEKIVIADKAAIIVDTVYDHPDQYPGPVILAATFLFAIQIYCDFGGYSHIAIGAAKVLNINLMQNFRQPYFATGIKDFWRRWHISLSSWFKDYLYIPLGGNRCSKTRQKINLMITFLASGLWHGASWHYVIWGGLQAVYQIVSGLTEKIRARIKSICRIEAHPHMNRLWMRAVTFYFASVGWLFFRAGSIGDGIFAFKKITVDFFDSGLNAGMWLQLGLNSVQICFLGVAVIVLTVVDFLHEQGKSVSGILKKQHMVIRWAAYYTVIYYIFISLLQTFGEDAGAFIYFQF